MIEITENDFDINEIISKQKEDKTGAVVTFLGTVRGFSGNKKVKFLEFDVYKEMAYEKFTEIEKITKENFNVQNITIVHRFGKLKVKENIVLIVVSSSHRKDAFKACEYIIDELKKIVPIWKKEITNKEEYWM